MTHDTFFSFLSTHDEWVLSKGIITENQQSFLHSVSNQDSDF